MSALGLPVLDRSVQTTNEWLRDVNDRIGWDRQAAYHALRAVLHTLRDRLTVHEAVDLAAQLPLLIRGIYYEGWKPAQTPVKLRSREAFVNAVSERLRGGPQVKAEEAVKAVFATLKAHCDPGEIADVGAQLPAELRSMLEAA